MFRNLIISGLLVIGSLCIAEGVSAASYTITPTTHSPMEAVMGTGSSVVIRVAQTQGVAWSAKLSGRSDGISGDAVDILPQGGVGDGAYTVSVRKNGLPPGKYLLFVDVNFGDPLRIERTVQLRFSVPKASISSPIIETISDSIKDQGAAAKGEELGGEKRDDSPGSTVSTDSNKNIVESTKNFVQSFTSFQKIWKWIILVLVILIALSFLRGKGNGEPPQSTLPPLSPPSS